MLIQQKPGFFAQIKSYPSTFWVANTMEIFERMAWYGWFTLSTLYITGDVATGGLGFTSEQRGQLQAIVPFLLYLMPVLTGALADRYGYKKMFTIAYIVMVVSYYSLGQFRTFPTFLLAFMFVAVGAAIFKPVVVGTIARVTNESNSALGFGIFYMMVNIGGFVGPIVAGVVRGFSWKYVFIACSLWALINLIFVTLFYKEPTTEAGSGRGRTLRKVLDDMVEVLGNLRFFITVFVILGALLLANRGFPWFSWARCGIFIAAWLAANFLYDALLPAGSGRPVRLGGTPRPALLKRMHCSNWRFAAFLLIMAGFWNTLQQIQITMPEYIRDFVDTRPMITAFAGDSESAGQSRIAENMATISPEERAVVSENIEHVSRLKKEGRMTEDELAAVSRKLLDSKVRLSPSQIDSLATPAADIESATDRAISLGRQVNPEFIVQANAGAIIFLQMLISYIMGRFHRFTTIVIGFIVGAIGIALPAFAGGAGMVGVGASLWIVILGILVFSLGEMMASPTSQEYIGRVAPRDKVALYMGYYFISIALGNLLAGILSGQLYGKLARDMQRPDLMWLAFGGILLFTAFLFMLYNWFAVPKHASDSLAKEA